MAIFGLKWPQLVNNDQIQPSSFTLKGGAYDETFFAILRFFVAYMPDFYTTKMIFSSEKIFDKILGTPRRRIFRFSGDEKKIFLMTKIFLTFFLGPKNGFKTIKNAKKNFQFFKKNFQIFKNFENRNIFFEKWKKKFLSFFIVLNPFVGPKKILKKIFVIRKTNFSSPENRKIQC